MKTLLEVGLVGPGKVGRALAAKLPEQRFHLGPVLSQSLVSARRGVRLMSRGTAADDPRALAVCDVILICAPGTLIVQVAERIAAADFSLAKKVVLHTDQTEPSGVLDALRRRGAAVGSLCPLCLFQRPPVGFDKIHFVIEGDSSAAAMARKIVRSLGGEALLVRPEQKVHHVIAKTVAAEFLTGLMQTAVDQLIAGGFTRKRAVQALTPLVDAALKDYGQSGGKSRPGPLLHLDAENIRKQLDALAATDPEAAREFRCAARHTLRVCGRALEGLPFLEEDGSAAAKAASS